MLLLVLALGACDDGPAAGKPVFVEREPEKEDRKLRPAGDGEEGFVFKAPKRAKILGWQGLHDAGPIELKEKKKKEQDFPAALLRAFGDPTSCLRDVRASRPTRLHIQITAAVTTSGRVTRADVSAPFVSAADIRCMEDRLGRAVLRGVEIEQVQTVRAGLDIDYEPPRNIGTPTQVAAPTRPVDEPAAPSSEGALELKPAPVRDIEESGGVGIAPAPSRDLIPSKARDVFGPGGRGIEEDGY